MRVSKARSLELKLGKDGFNEIFYVDDNYTLRWKVRLSKNSPHSVGDVAGTLSKKTGYYHVNCFNTILVVHRIIWIMHNGDIPDGCVIDHINTIRTDNRLSNLRVVTEARNLRNLAIRKENTSGYVGVHYDNGRWRAMARDSLGRKKHLGRFSDKVEAAKAVYWYKAWLLATYGEEYSYTGPCCQQECCEEDESQKSKNNVKTS